jgi:hypothetical protein
MEQKGSWLRAILMALAIPILLGLFSNFIIPNIIEKSNKAEALRTARLKKALDIRDRNEDFTVKLHRLKTRNIDRLSYELFNLDKEMSTLFVQSHYKPDR